MVRHRFTKKDRQKARRARKETPQSRKKWTARDSRAYQQGFEAGFFHGKRDQPKRRRFFRRG